MRLVGDFRRVKRGDSAAAAPRRQRKANEVIAELRQRLAQAEADFAALRDPLLPEEEARVAELAAAMGAADFAAREELATLARKRHWRLRDLVAQTCGAPQVSGTGAMDADESTRTRGARHDCSTASATRNAQRGYRTASTIYKLVKKTLVEDD